MLVEDDPVTAIGLEYQIRGLGYDVCANVPNGWDALDQAERLSPDLAIMDIHIEGELDGIETARRLFNLPRPPSVIFLTSTDDPSIVDRVADLRPAGFLSKPVTPTELRACIEVALAKAALDDQLAESERRTRRILSTVSDGIVVEDDHGGIVYANPAMAKFLGLSEDQLVGRFLVDQVDADSRAQVLAQEPRKRLGEPGAYDAVLLDGGGARRDVVINDAPLFDRGALVLTVSAVSDVTERNQALRRAQDAEARYRGLFENALAGILVTAADGRLLDCNPAAARILGYDSAEQAVEQIHDLGVQHYVDQEDRIRFIEDLRLKGEVTDFETPMYGKDGDLIWLSVAARGIFSEDGGDLLLTEAIVVDITDRKVAQANYEATLDLFQRTVRTIPSPLVLVDLDGEISLANTAFQKLFGEKDVEGCDYEELVRERLAPAPAGDRRRISLGPEERVIRLSQGEDAVAVFIESRSDYTDHQGEVIGRMLVWRDITGLVGSQRDRRQGGDSCPPCK